MRILEYVSCVQHECQYIEHIISHAILTVFSRVSHAVQFNLTLEQLLFVNMVIMLYDQKFFQELISMLIYLSDQFNKIHSRCCSLIKYQIGSKENQIYPSCTYSYVPKEIVFKEKKKRDLHYTLNNTLHKVCFYFVSMNASHIHVCVTIVMRQKSALPHFMNKLKFSLN